MLVNLEFASASTGITMGVGQADTREAKRLSLWPDCCSFCSAAWRLFGNLRPAHSGNPATIYRGTDLARELDDIGMIALPTSAVRLGQRRLAWSHLIGAGMDEVKDSLKAGLDSSSLYCNSRAVKGGKFASLTNQFASRRPRAVAPKLRSLTGLGSKSS
jgi:hypothetical protein